MYRSQQHSHEQQDHSIMCATDFIMPPSAHKGHGEEVGLENGKDPRRFNTGSSISESHDYSEDHKELLSKMRDACELQRCSTKHESDATLMRFLKARSMKVDKASKMFIQHQDWRASFVPLGYVPESECQKELDGGKIFLQGRAHNGWPVCFVHVRKHDITKRNMDELRRLIIYFLDKTIASAATEEGKVISVIDLKEITYKQIDIRAFIAGFGFLQAYYPERLGRCYLINVPSIFLRVWKLIERTLDKATREKIVFLDSNQTMEAYLSIMDMDVLPIEYGGNANLTMLQDAVVQNWPPIQENAMEG